MVAIPYTSLDLCWEVGIWMDGLKSLPIRGNFLLSNSYSAHRSGLSALWKHSSSKGDLGFWFYPLVHGHSPCLPLVLSPGPWAQPMPAPGASPWSVGTAYACLWCCSLVWGHTQCPPCWAAPLVVLEMNPCIGQAISSISYKNQHEPTQEFTFSLWNCQSCACSVTSWGWFVLFLFCYKWT